MKSLHRLRHTKPECSDSIEHTTFAFLDIETTGLYPNRGARISEIAICDRNKILQYWIKQDAQLLSCELSQTWGALDKSVIVGHNIHFDLQFLSYEADRINCSGPVAKFVDTLTIAKRVLPKQNTYTLADLLTYFKITPRASLHSALVDAEATRALFWKLIAAGNLHTLADLELQRIYWTTF